LPLAAAMSRSTSASVRCSRVRRSPLGRLLGVTVRFTVAGVTSRKRVFAMCLALPAWITVRIMPSSNGHQPFGGLRNDPASMWPHWSRGDSDFARPAIQKALKLASIEKRIATCVAAAKHPPGFARLNKERGNTLSGTFRHGVSKLHRKRRCHPNDDQSSRQTSHRA
jgi:hypothetical protein